jgi:hypothetical protein
MPLLLGFPGPKFTCKTCAYYAAKNGGSCRLRPPQQFVVDDAVQTWWPMVAEDDFCGAHQLPRTVDEPMGKPGRPANDYSAILAEPRQNASTPETAASLRGLHRLAAHVSPIAMSTLHMVLQRWLAAGVITAVSDGDGAGPTRYYVPPAELTVDA